MERIRLQLQRGYGRNTAGLRRGYGYDGAFVEEAATPNQGQISYLFSSALLIYLQVPCYLGIGTTHGEGHTISLVLCLLEGFKNPIVTL